MKQRLPNGSTIVFHIDITEMKEAVLKADIANRSKSEFLANISHELRRTPLNAIIGFSETLDRGVFGPLSNEKQQEYVSDIHESGKHLLDLINEVLDVSTIEAGKLELSNDEVDIGSTIESALRLIKSRAEQGGIELIAHHNSQNSVILGDERRIKQILVNLLSNAVKFTQQGGMTDGALSISVTDTDYGMSEQDIERALEKFGQIRRVKGIANEGTGLGLPLTKGLIEAHGGSLKIESIVGEGTTVSVLFPNERILN